MNATGRAAAEQLYERGLALWSEGITDEAVLCFEQALGEDPEIGELPQREGVARMRAGEFAAAEGWLWLAHLFRPRSAVTLGCLGEVLTRLGRPEEALPLLR